MIEFRAFTTGEIYIVRDYVALQCRFSSNNDLCSSDCPFFDHRPKQGDLPESAILHCRAKEISFYEGEES